jgi:hypothetical protein
LGTDDTILYSSCFDANTGLFESLLTQEDAVISDALNHASIIDGVRLCRAQRKIFRHNDMADLEEKLRETREARFRIISTDGVFSMQGDMANLNDMCDLADRYDALVMVDDSHATGFVGPGGKGTPAHLGVAGPGGHHHQHPGKGFGWGLRRVHQQQAGDRRPLATTFSAVPLLKYPGPSHGPGGAESAGTGPATPGPSAEVVGQHGILQKEDDRARL